MAAVLRTHTLHDFPRMASQAKLAELAAGDE